MNKNRISNTLAVLLLTVTCLGTVFFFFKLKASFTEWLFFNPCSISSIVFLTGFIIFKLSGNQIILYISVLPMFFFGTLAMFIFPWKGMNIVPQIAHIIMTLNIFQAISVSLRKKDFFTPMIGLLLSILIFAPFISLQQKYENSHFDKAEEVLMNSS